MHGSNLNTQNVQAIGLNQPSLDGSSSVSEVSLSTGQFGNVGSVASCDVPHAMQSQASASNSGEGQKSLEQYTARSLPAQATLLWQTQAERNSALAELFAANQRVVHISNITSRTIEELQQQVQDLQKALEQKSAEGETQHLQVVQEPLVCQTAEQTYSSLPGEAPWADATVSEPSDQSTSGLLLVRDERIQQLEEREEALNTELQETKKSHAQAMDAMKHHLAETTGKAKEDNAHLRRQLNDSNNQLRRQGDTIDRQKRFISRFKEAHTQSLERANQFKDYMDRQKAQLLQQMTDIAGIRAVSDRKLDEFGSQFTRLVTVYEQTVGQNPSLEPVGKGLKKLHALFFGQSGVLRSNQIMRARLDSLTTLFSEPNRQKSEVAGGSATDKGAEKTASESSAGNRSSLSAKAGAGDSEKTSHGENQDDSASDIKQEPVPFSFFGSGPSTAGSDNDRATLGATGKPESGTFSFGSGSSIAVPDIDRMTLEEEGDSSPSEDIYYDV